MRFNYLAFLCVIVSPFNVAIGQNPTTSDPQALAYAAQSIAALTGGGTITDVTLNANVTSFLSSSNDTGTGIFLAKGTMESRLDLTLGSGSLTEVRNVLNGGPAGAWSRNGNAATAQAPPNTLTDAAWFFPAFSCLTQSATQTFVFTYIGQEQHGGVTTQHIRVALAAQTGALNPQLGLTDFYLDPVSLLPLAVDFSIHPDNDANTNIPVEILFDNYQVVNGIQVPFHFQKTVNGGVILDVTVTSTLFNTGLLDGIFTLQ